MKFKILFLFALSICLAQFAFGQDAAKVNLPTPGGYLVGPGDVLRISVLNEQEFNVPLATVDEDGKVYIPFSEEGVVVKCRSEKQLKADFAGLLSRYLKNPQVSVNVVERNSRPPATVFGEVRAPQQVTLTRKTRLLDVISFSGGVTEDAGGIIQVYRLQKPLCGEQTEDSEWTADAAQTEDGEFIPSRMYSYSGLRKGSNEANPVIYPGDVIVVHKALPIYITGEVGAPQGVYIKEGGLSLTEAIAKIGGIRPTAETKNIKIYRLKPNSKDRDTISVNYNLIKQRQQSDVMLEPYDIVEVDKSKKSIAQIALEMVTGISRTALSGIGAGLPNRILY